jgi:hypothetical protein
MVAGTGGATRHTEITDLIHILYRIKTDETGHSTQGHKLLEKNLDERRIDPLYGEILPEGILTMLDSQHLRGKSKATGTIVELGMGIGKGVIQIFYEFENVTTVIGIEMSKIRYQTACNALSSLITTGDPEHFTIVEKGPRRFYVQWKKPNGRRKRYIDLRYGDCLEDMDIWTRGDAFIFNVKIPDSRFIDLCWCTRFMKKGSRICSYMDLNDVANQVHMPIRFQEFAKQDRYLTSWAKNSGHHFYSFTRL